MVIKGLICILYSESAKKADTTLSTHYQKNRKVYIDDTWGWGGGIIVIV